MCVCVHDRGRERDKIHKQRQGGGLVCLCLFACMCDRQQATERVGMCVCLHLSLCLHVFLGVCVKNRQNLIPF
jgi:hypothetical protein